MRFHRTKINIFALKIFRQLSSIKTNSAHLSAGYARPAGSPWSNSFTDFKNKIVDLELGSPRKTQNTRKTKKPKMHHKSKDLCRGGEVVLCRLDSKASFNHYLNRRSRPRPAFESVIWILKESTTRCQWWKKNQFWPWPP